MLPSSSATTAPAHPAILGKRPRRERGGKNQRRDTYRPALPGGDWGSSPAQPAAPYACPSQPNHPPRGWTPPTSAAPMPPLLRAHPAPCVHSAPPPPLSNHRHWVKPGLEFHGNPHGAPRPALPGAMRPPPGALRPIPPGAARPAQHAGPRPPCPPGAARPPFPADSRPAPCARSDSRPAPRAPPARRPAPTQQQQPWATETKRTASRAETAWRSVRSFSHEEWWITEENRR